MGKASNFVSTDATILRKQIVNQCPCGKQIRITGTFFSGNFFLHGNCWNRQYLSLFGIKKQTHFHIEVLHNFFRDYFRTEYQNKTVSIGSKFKFFQTFFSAEIHEKTLKTIETIIAGVFAACVLHETFRFSKVFSVVIFLPKISIWPCLFVPELIEWNAFRTFRSSRTVFRSIKCALEFFFLRSREYW